MANEIKITKKMKYSAIATLMQTLDKDTVLENGIKPNDIVDFCNKEVEMLNKKNASKTESKKDKEKKEKDTALKNAILNSLEKGVKYSCMDIRNVCPEVANFVDISASKLAYLLTDMVNKDETLCREVIKRVPHFYLANNEVEG